MADVKISAADVKALRERTGAGMMDCKAALQESGGDVDKGGERPQGKAGKAAGRERSGARVVDCEAALQGAGGDVDKAVEQLKVKLGKQVGKLAGRETTEG